MNGQPPHLYRANGERLGIDHDVLDHAVRDQQSAKSRGATPILSLRHLAHLTGASYGYLREVVERESDPYEDIARKKKTGRVRPIAAPEPILMDVQRYLLDNALRGLPHHAASYAYRRNRSIFECASQHVGARWLVKFDMHDFFGQVSERRVYPVFHERGYSRLVSFELTRLTTRIYGRQPERSSPERYPAIPTYGVHQVGRLPQGAPTSGALANAVATPLDETLSALAISRGLVFTRYSDDLVFSSGDRAFTRGAATDLIREVQRATSSHGFALHRKKTRIVPPGSRHIVLGLLVDGDSVRLLPEFRRRIDVHVRGVNKWGPTAHAEHRGFDSMFSFVSHVDGSLAFASSVDPTWAALTRVRWHDALVKWHFPIHQGRSE